MNGGTVKKIEGDLWEGRWREDGRQFRRRFRTKGMAEDAIRAARDRDERRRRNPGTDRADQLPRVGRALSGPIRRPQQALVHGHAQAVIGEVRIDVAAVAAA